MAKWLKVEVQGRDPAKARLVKADAVTQVASFDDGSFAVFVDGEWHTVHTADETLKDYVGVFDSLELGDLA